jgi:hypothetical protein
MKLFILMLIILNSMWVLHVEAQSVGSVVNLDFYTVEVGASAGNNKVKLGTNGIVEYLGGFSGAGIGLPGSFVITGTLGADVRIRCRKTITLANSGGTDSVQVQVGFNVGTANATTYANRVSCKGVNRGGAVHTMTGISTQDTVLIAGKIMDIPAGYGTYNTSNPSGLVMKFRILYI